jgi:plasmid stabilization system protein ParE
MPRFRVIVQPEAERNVSSVFDWLAERSPQVADSWYRAFEQAIDRLRESADHFPLAPESRHFSVKISEILFKTRRGQPYRLLFTLQSGDVNVLYVRGPGQDLVTP